MKKQLTSFILIIALVITMLPMAGITALAANDPTTIDVSDDSGTNLPAGVSYSGNVFTIGAGASGSTIAVIGTTIQNAIVIDGGVTVELILSGASITVPGGSAYSPIDLQDSASVTLQLADGTTNTMSAVNTNNRAGIRIASSGGISSTLTVDGSGTLNSIGGSIGTFAGAGIGGSDSEEGGTINISDGIINTTGGGIIFGRGGAGIGGGNGGAGGTINISGGTVNAVSAFYGAGIGGGFDGAGGTINISDGIVNGTCIDGAGAGIGGGGGGGAGGTITINGGNVSATGELQGAGIGGGINGSGGNIIINGGDITATGKHDGAGIGGGGGGGAGGTITISGFATTVNATGGPGGGAGIGGGGAGGAGGNITISPSATVMAVAKNKIGLSKSAIDAVSGIGSVINAQLVNAISAGSDTYLKSSGNKLKLPATYKCFAFSASAASPINAWSDQACTVLVAGIVRSPGGHANIPLSATIDEAPTAVTTALAFTLTVELNGGNGSTASSPYASGAAVSIDAGTKSGYTFSSWTSSNGGTFTNLASASTTFTMPGNATTITAIWTEDPLTYNLSVNLDGGNGGTVGGSYASGAAVSIDAGTKSGYTFSRWTSSNGGTFTNAASASTTFTMPGNATTIAAVWTQDSTGGSGGGSHTAPGTNITIDGENYIIGDENKEGTDTTVTVDQNKFEDGIAKASENSVVTIPVSANNSVTAQLVVKNIEDMAKKDMILIVRTGKISYNLNTSAIDTAGITESLGTSDSGRIPFNVRIANSSAVVNDAEMVVSPVEFTITATYNGKTVHIDTFSSFVDRTIEITAEQAKKITTAVVVEPNGSLRHIPTKVTVIGGKYYAVVNSLTNSIYTVIWNPVEFSDTTTHWSKDTVNDMGSRMVISGVGQGNFEPDRDITRAEFAAIVIRALGLAPGEGMNSFTDVSNADWYCGYIKTAAAYGIITGYDAAIFGPNDKITREQAMTMITRAMKITDIKSDMKDEEIHALIGNYADGMNSSDYAKTSIAACLKTGMVTGRSNDTIAPKDSITRAEVAVIVQRLLQKSNLI